MKQSEITKTQAGRGRRLAATLLLGAALVAVTPSPAHAGLIEAVSGIFSFLTGSKYPGSDLTATLGATTARASLTDTESTNDRTNVSAKTAAEIAKDHTFPKSYDACKTTKAQQAALASAGDAEAAAKAGATSNASIKATLYDTGEMLKSKCDAKVLEKSNANKALLGSDCQ